MVIINRMFCFPRKDSLLYMNLLAYFHPTFASDIYLAHHHHHDTLYYIGFIDVGYISTDLILISNEGDIRASISFPFAEQGTV